MKKTIATMVLSLTATAAMAATATFEGVSGIQTAVATDGITFTPVTDATYAIVTGATKNNTSSGNRTSSIIALSINYDKIFNADNTLKTVTDGEGNVQNAVGAQYLIATTRTDTGSISSKSVGLAYNGNGGIWFTWSGNNGTTWSTAPSKYGSQALSLTSTAVINSLITATNGDRWLTVVFTPSVGQGDGSTLWSASGNELMKDTGLKTDQVNSTILVNTTGLIESVSFDSNIAITNTDNKSGVIAAASNVPEPATATLSLLALAGLAARRRRK